MINTTKRTRTARRFTLNRADGTTIQAQEIVTEMIISNTNGYAASAPQIISRRYETATGQPINPTDDGQFELAATGERLTDS